MDRSLDRFIDATVEKSTAGDRFERESERLLRIELDGGVWLRPGAAVAHRGEISFERLHTMDARSAIDAALREVSPLIHASGRGRLYCANHAWHVQIIRLTGQTVYVSWVELLAFEESLDFELTMVEHGISLAAGGLVVVKLSGHGAVAFAAHGTPLTLPVTPGHPVSTDPHATVAWWGVAPALEIDLTWRSVFAHAGQEPVQMFFEGTGFVVVQPFEDPRRFTLPKNPADGVMSILANL